MCKSFGATQIIRGVNLDIARGERHAIIGPNGAGKTTLFNLISGRFPITCGHDRAERRRASIGCRRNGSIGSVCRAASRSPRSFARLTVFENLRCALLWSRRLPLFVLASAAAAARAERGDRAAAGRSQSRARAATVPAGLLSYAEQRALEIGMTVAGGASVILLDEPTAGMSHSETEYAVALIRRVTAGQDAGDGGARHARRVRPGRHDHACWSTAR